MTTNSYTSSISHSNTTNFRIWGLALSNALTAIGFIKSADTGQINWATVNRPGVGASAGYEIRYLNDSLHASAPIYVKLEFSTGLGGAAYPNMFITVGTGTNGSGTITGVIMPRTENIGGYYALDSTVSSYQTHCCMVDGCAWFVLKADSKSSAYPVAFFSVHRTEDSSGTPTAQGAVVYMNYLGAYAYVWAYEFTTGFNYTYASIQSSYTFMPGDLWTLGTIHAGVPGDYQVARHYCAMPLVTPISTIVSMSQTDGVALGATFDCRVLGVYDRTYISLGNNGSQTPETFALIWE